MFALFIQKLCERRHSPKKFSLRLVIGGVCQQGDFAQPWPLVRFKSGPVVQAPRQSLIFSLNDTMVHSIVRQGRELGTPIHLGPQLKNHSRLLLGETARPSVSKNPNPKFV
jgi:hypothetical protein